MTALCGLARTFPQLVLARIGVGVGEAGCSPPAHSLISDYHPPERRGRAFATYALGIPIGTAFGYLLGGWMSQELGWRSAFLLVGLPGLLLALVVRLTLREPPRGFSEARRDGSRAGRHERSGHVASGELPAFRRRRRCTRSSAMASRPGMPRS
jgi:MFS family permease